MAEINILEPQVYNLISAGEVVDRPSSVVKELVENAIDAGSSNITISIKSGGATEICINDDGGGIDESNLHKCFLPHATSKLNVAADLDNIATLGFRGEALPSICAVAQVKICSKTSAMAIGNFIEIHGGRVIDSGQIGNANGTQITVSNLFFNTPVRAKFLKNEKQETSYITTIVEQLIFANPSVKIKYSVDGKIVLQSGGDILSCIYAIYGNEIANQMISFESEFFDLKVSGYIGNRYCSKNNRTYQIIAVNGRVVTDNSIPIAVAQGYGDSLMKRQFPVFAINLELPREEVDVNIHPNKREVRFADSRKIFSCVYKAVSLALAKNESVALFDKKNMNSNIAPQIAHEYKSCNDFDNNTATIFDTNKNSLDALIKKQQETIAEFDARSAQANVSTVTRSVMQGFAGNSNYSGNVHLENDLNENYKNEALKLKNDTVALKNDTATLKNDTATLKNDGYHNIFEKSDSVFQNEEIVSSTEREVDDLFKQIELSLSGEFEIVGQIFKTYLIIQKDGKVYLLDQHACHERILYDELMIKINSHERTSQQLLLPYIFDTSATQYEFLLSIVHNLCDIGFDICEFGNMSFKVNGVPNIISSINLKTFFDNLITDKKEFSSNQGDLIKEKLAQNACKAAIKAGDSLNLEQIRGLFSEMKAGLPLQCPHGRPAIIEFSRNDLDKLFKRIV